MKSLVFIGLFQLFLLVNSNSYEDNQVKFVADFPSRINNDVDQIITKQWSQELIYLYYGTYFSRGDVALEGFSKFFHQRSLAVGESRKRLTTIVNKRGGYVSFGNIGLPDMCATIKKSVDKYKVGLGIDNPPFSCTAYICRFLKKDGLKNEVPSSARSRDKGKSVVSVNENIIVPCDMELADLDKWMPGLYALRDLLAMESYVYDSITGVIDKCQTNEKKDPMMRHHLEEFLPDLVDTKKKAAGYIARLLEYSKSDDDKDYNLGEYVIDRDLDHEEEE